MLPPPPDDAEDKEAFITRDLEAQRAESARIKAMTSKELLAELTASQDADKRASAEMRWHAHQSQRHMASLTAHTTTRLPLSPSPDLASRLEALEDSVSLLHTKIDTIIAQLAARDPSAPDGP